MHREWADSHTALHAMQMMALNYIMVATCELEHTENISFNAHMSSKTHTESKFCM
jgi:hypothetical protein